VPAAATSGRAVRRGCVRVWHSRARTAVGATSSGRPLPGATLPPYASSCMHAAGPARCCLRAVYCAPAAGYDTRSSTRSTPCTCDACYGLDSCLVALSLSRSAAAPEPNVGRTWIRRPYSTIVQLYKVQQFRCYRSGPRRLLGEYGGIEADRQTTSSRQQAAADS
jgi:hypothetical protein